MDGNELWRYRVGKKGKEWKDWRKDEVYEVGTGFREKNTRIHGKRRDQEGKVKRERAGRRAWGFEKRLEEGRGSELTRSCWRELRERAWEGKVGSEWDEERRRSFEDRG